MSLPPSTNKAPDRLVLREELFDIFDGCIKESFPELADEFKEGCFTLISPLVEDTHKNKYGDYVCKSMLIISEGLRRANRDFFDETSSTDLAKRLLKAVKKLPSAENMLTDLRLEDGIFLTFRLSPLWMTERIKIMLNDEGGMDTWAPRTYQRSIVLAGPAPDLSAYRHADEIRFRYIKEMLISMLSYSGVVVGTSLNDHDSRKAVEEHFAEKQGVITSIRHKTDLFAFRGRKPREFCEDLQNLWSAIKKLKGRAVVYLTPVRRLEYVGKCFDAARDEEWLPVEENLSVLLLCCGYRTSSVEREKLAYLWKIYESDSKVASLLQLGLAAGYSRESCMECAIKYAYLSTHRLAECKLNIDEMLDKEGNTFASLLKTHIFISSLSENSGGGGMVMEYDEVCLSKEHELALHLVQFTEVIDMACTKFLLHPVCKYSWLLCNKFMSYYSQVMEFLDLNTYKSKFFLCDATKAVLGKCFHLLGITPESSGESSRVPRVKKGPNVYCSSLDPRPDNVNPRFELFCMSIVITNPSIKKGAVHGYVSLVDSDRTWNQQDHVVYFNRHWYDAIGIGNNLCVHFESPSPCHIVSFSLALEIYVRLYVTTADKCYQNSTRIIPIFGTSNYSSL